MTGLEFMTFAQVCHGRFPLMMLKTQNFDLILSRRRNEILLLALNHQYRVERA